MTVAYLRSYFVIFREGLREFTTILSKDGQFPGKDLNPAPTQCEARTIASPCRRSMHLVIIMANRYKRNVL